MHDLVATIGFMDLPDLDQIREWIRRIQEYLVLGGVGLATLGSLTFLLAWAASHVRRPLADAPGKPVLSFVTLGSSYVPVALTGVAAAGIVVPVFAPFILKSFALAVVVAALSWCLAVVCIFAGGNAADMRRVRRALLLAGTPWYCLAVYLATYL